MARISDDSDCRGEDPKACLFGVQSLYVVHSEAKGLNPCLRGRRERRPTFACSPAQAGARDMGWTVPEGWFDLVGHTLSG